MSRLAIVTATTNRARAEDCVSSWYQHAADRPDILVITNGEGPIPYLGTVPAFAEGVNLALARTDADIIACLHDDLQIHEHGWDQKVIAHFDRQPACGLAGFGGAIALGSDDLYKGPYQPLQLARAGFRSNLRDAEVHGFRSLFPERVACLDGFSQIGRRDFWLGAIPRTTHETGRGPRPWTLLESLGVIHHAYDGMLGCLAARYGWETWYLPIACTHFGGRTAVGDPGYQAWASTTTTGGDHGFWEAAHKIWYEHFRDVLPLRV